MSKSNTFETELLKLLFQNVDMTLVGDAGGIRGSAAAGSLYLALHTADPGEGGDQTTNEIAYTGYSRAAVARTAGAWSVVSGAVANIAAIAWPTCSGGGGTATYASIGVAGSGTSKILYSFALSPSIVVSPGVTPRLEAGDLTGAED